MILSGNTDKKKLSFEKVSFHPDGCISLESYRERFFNSTLHYHPEMELTYVAEGTGRALIGSEWMTFSPGHLALIGRNTPHLYVAVPAADEVMETRVIKFSTSFLEKILDVPEFSAIRTMFASAGKALIFPDADRREFFSALDGKGALLLLLRVLELLASMTTQPYRVLGFPGTSPGKFHPEDQRRIDEVIRFLQCRFTQVVTLEDAARSIQMETEPFRKFFKRHVRLSFSDYLLELRLTLACKLLRETSHGIWEVANLSGFRNISNFNRLFLARRHMTPKAYRKL